MCQHVSSPIFHGSSCSFQCVRNAASVADRAEGEQRGEDEEACEEDLKVALDREDAHPREVEVEGGDAGGDVPRVDW